MPPAVIAAGIAGAGSLGGALIGSHAQGQANKAQQNANNQALAYQRERDSAADKRYERDYSSWQQREANKYATKKAIAAKYGITLPDWAPAPGPAAAQPPISRPGVVPGEARPGTPGYTGRPAGQVTGGPAGMVPSGMPVAPDSPQGMAMIQRAGLVNPGASPGGMPAPAGPEMAAPGPVTNGSDWNDWRKYGAV